MKKRLIGSIVLILITLILFKFFLSSPDQKLVKPQVTSTNLEKQTSPPEPTPSAKPIEVNQSTQLKELNSSLTPEDFSSDYKDLKNSI